jgi:hypothetical protein
MKCDLNILYRELGEQLSTAMVNEENFSFSSGNLLVPHTEVLTYSMYTEKRFHEYESGYRMDSLWFYADKNTYKHVGLLLLSVVFHKLSDPIYIKLINPKSDIKQVIVNSPNSSVSEVIEGYYVQPNLFVYRPQIIGKHPFERDIDPRNLVRFALSNTREFLSTEEEWKSRDTIYIYGNDTSFILLAELLLNASLPNNETEEYELEGEGGFRGVGKWSAEVKFLLPEHT